MDGFAWTVVGSVAGVACAIASIVFGLVPLAQSRRRRVKHGGSNGASRHVALSESSVRSEFWHAVMRPRYLEQVRRIAPTDPPGLIGRDGELAALALFCLDEGQRHYMYWQGGAWAGKSALLSTFVLNPPPEIREKAWIVSFFITARLAGQDIREAFVQTVLQQLADLTGWEVLGALPEPAREACLAEWLAEAAAMCAEAGGRLILVVDGLDEDRGNADGLEAHTIAGLLPGNPPPGMRVIVSGRPNPPLPDDVPEGHPLRDPGNVRDLADSPYASGLRRLARQELQGLLDGTHAEQEMLGLITAARGGLSSPDLADLSGIAPREVEAILHSAAGRTFARRPGGWEPATGPEVWIFAHDELQEAAAGYLGERLAGYGDRLHAWAGTYRAAGWPPGTPTYLLGGYYWLVHRLGDLPRMVAIASDAERHDRMLDLSGGDGLALTEVDITLDLVAGLQVADLTVALHLAWRRDQLVQRNYHIPAGLPVVWLRLGYPGRAMALARSAADPAIWERALAEMATAQASGGCYGAAKVTAEAISDSYERSRVVAAIAGTMARTGQYRQAEITASTMSDPYERAVAQAEIASALAGSGHRRRAAAIGRQAEEAARSAGFMQVEALALVAPTLAASGQMKRAVAAARDAGIAARRSPLRPWNGAAAAGALAEVGQYEQARALALSAPGTGEKARALASVAEALARAGRYEQAEAIACSVGSPYEHADALGAVARALAKSGRYRHASSLASQAEEAALSIHDPAWRALALSRAARTLAAIGDKGRAAEAAGESAQAARSISDHWHRGMVLTTIAGSLAGAGLHRQAAALARQAETAARSTTDLYRLALKLASIANALATAGQMEQAAIVAEHAESAARSISSPNRQSTALAEVAAEFARVGQCRKAEDVARSITVQDEQLTGLTAVARSLAQSGHIKEAESVAYSITIPDEQARALMDLAWELARVGHHDQAEAVARSIANPGRRDAALVHIAGALAEVGQCQKAKTVALSISGPHDRSRALEWLADSLARGSQFEQAELIARSAARPGDQAVMLAKIAVALARAGRVSEAVAIVDETEAPQSASGSRNHRLIIELARALAIAGEHERAEMTIRAITKADWLSTALTSLVEALAEAKQYEKAETVARSIADPDDQTRALAFLAEDLAGSAQYQRAEKVARSVIDQAAQAWVLKRLAKALVKSGQHQRAEIVARSITDTNQRDQALAEVAEMLTEFGRYEHAELVAHEIANPEMLTQVLVNLALAFVRAGNQLEACRVAASTCVTGRWSEAAVPVLTIDPSAFTLVGRELQRAINQQKVSAIL